MVKLLVSIVAACVVVVDYGDIGSVALVVAGLRIAQASQQ